VLVFAFASINISQAFDQPTVGPNAPAWDGDFQTNILGNNNDSNKFSSANVVENADGSILERLQFIQSKLTANPVFDDKFTIADDPDNQASVFQFLTTLEDTVKKVFLKIGVDENSLLNALTIESDQSNNIKVGVGTDEPTAELDVDGTLRMRALNCSTLNEGGKLTTDADGNIVCAADVSTSGGGGGDITDGVSEGSGEDVFRVKDGTTLKFRSLIGGNGITLTEGATDITIDNDVVNTNLTNTEVDTFATNETTANYIPKSDGDSLVDSSIKDSGGNISIGTSTGDRELSIGGSMNMVDGINDAPQIIGFKGPVGESGGVIYTHKDQANDHSITLKAGGSNGLTVLGNGNVGIGTSAPEKALHVIASGAKLGGTYHPQATAILEKSGESLLEIKGNSTHGAGVVFSDEDDNDIGGVLYNHPSDTLRLRAGDSEPVLVNSDRMTVSTTLHMPRKRIGFSSTYDDTNHAIYNNYDNIDAEGSWDGMKMNVYNGLDIRTGNANGAVPNSVVQVRDEGLYVNGTITVDKRSNNWTSSCINGNFRSSVGDNAGNYEISGTPLAGIDYAQLRAGTASISVKSYNTSNCTTGGGGQYFYTYPKTPYVVRDSPNKIYLPNNLMPTMGPGTSFMLIATY
jgi:hypothetical protein